MKRVALPLLLVVALIAIAVAGWWLKRPGEAVAVACADPVAGCRFDHGGAPVVLRFSAPPAPLEAFDMTLTAPGVTRAHAEFQMVGMDMGFNRYDFKTTGQNAWSARATLPLCVSGRRDWILVLELDGRRYAIPFSTR